jgi:hypothetical protein
MFGMSPEKNCYLLAAPVPARPLSLPGGIHHNAVGIAIRRFTQRLQSDRTLLEKDSLVQKELEPR